MTVSSAKSRQATEAASPIPQDKPAVPRGEGGGDKAGGRRTRGRAAQVLESYALLFLLVAAVIFFSVWPETSAVFPTIANLRILVASQAVLGVVTLGALVPLIGGQFDLSVGANTALSAVLVAMTLSSGVPVLVGVAVAVGLGAAVGLANGLIATRLHVPAIVGTLGMSTILIGVIRHVTGGLVPPSNIPAVLIGFGTGTIAGIPTIFIGLLVIAGVVYFVLDHTPFGRRVYAFGNNPAAAELVGLRLRSLGLAVLVVGATLCGIAGLLYVARAGGADPGLANVFLLPAFAAALLSAACVRPGRYNVWGAIIAIYFLAVINNGLNLAGAKPYVSDYINGGALIVGIALAARLRQRRQQRT